MTASDASALLEAAARDRGLTVQRLDPEIVVCGDEHRRVVFHGLCGARSTKVAHELCGNVAWLRTHLAARGLPVPETRPVDLDDLDCGQAVAEELGFPVSLITVDADGQRDAVAADPAEFRELWYARVVETEAGSAYVQRPADAGLVDLAVVAGVVVATAAVTGAVTAGSAGSAGRAGSSGSAEPAGDQVRLAQGALVALAGTCYATVRLAGVADGSPAAGGRLRVDSVDPTMSRWTDPADRAAVTVARAVLDVEFSAG